MLGEGAPAPEDMATGATSPGEHVRTPGPPGERVRMPNTRGGGERVRMPNAQPLRQSHQRRGRGRWSHKGWWRWHNGIGPQNPSRRRPVELEVRDKPMAEECPDLVLRDSGHNACSAGACG
jgi:hypothetical protein